MKRTLFLSFLLYCLSYTQGADYVGCYRKLNPQDIKTAFSENRYTSTVDACVTKCKSEYLRFAHLQGGNQCICTTFPEDSNTGNCNTPCKGNSSEFCGGDDSRSVYDTGQIVSGPPASLTLVNATETSLQIKWTPPLNTNNKITSYELSAVAIETYSQSALSIPREWVYSGSSRRANLTPLQPGTTYNFSLMAVTDDGKGIPISKTFSTIIGVPEEPDVPTIVRKEKDQITIKIPTAINENGPITSYQVIVVDESISTAFHSELLKAYSFARKDGLTYYITAELTPENIVDNFVIGDGQFYGGYYNAPLDPNADIHVGLAVISSKDGVTKKSYALATHDQHGVIVFDLPTPTPSNGLVIGLSIAIGIFGFLLILSIIVFLFLRHHVNKRRRRIPYQQELTLQGPMDEVETSNGYVHNGYMPDDIRVDHYANLKQQVWNIPADQLQIENDLLGKGKFGEVRQGKVQLRGCPTQVGIHVINDLMLSPDNKKQMLRELDILIKSGKHENLVTLIGTHETADLLYVIVEYHPATLKDVLLESRLLEHIAPNQHSNRFCSLSEHHLLQVAYQIACALEFLHSKRITHKQVCARNILMADGVTPKLGGHGISDFSRLLEKPTNMVRWSAQEVFRGGHFVQKSDVWAYACVLWEIATLGGTPYNNVSTKDLPARILRGLILPQPKHVSDDLYQLMLQCWQIDLDERPTFQEIIQIILNILQNTLSHINFNTYLGFHYESYHPDAEQM